MKIGIAAAAISIAALYGNANAADWPTRTVRIIVPSVPGDGSDSAARVIAQSLETTFAQPIVVENMSGAGGVVVRR